MSVISRRNFITSTVAGAASLVLSGCMKDGDAQETKISLQGPSILRGHLLRTNDLTPAASVGSTHGVVIVGGGISGLSAAWKLLRSGFEDFVLLEVEDEVGGNSRAGRNNLTSFPWGAHYVPVPGRESTELHTFFEEIGVITGRTPDGVPIYNEEYLCAAPEERLFINGVWQEGLVPRVGVDATERSEFDRFFSMIEKYKEFQCQDGKKAFAVPVAESSREAALRELDTLSMAAFLTRENFHGEKLRWYIDYCCRDDYGCSAERVSAWAGIHYFAARGAWAANATGYEVLTWPEGNNFLVQKLRARCVAHIQTAAMAFNIEPAKNGMLTIDYHNFSTGASHRAAARAVIYAAPRFTVPYVAKNVPALTQTVAYYPWLVANLSLRELPDFARRAPHWDNVIYGSNSLGYVHAEHQLPRLDTLHNTITYFEPYCAASAREERLRIAQLDELQLYHHVIEELSKAHPTIAQYVADAKLWIWGHGMSAPAPGFLSWDTQEGFAQSNKIFFAHTDMSGISIFEEGHYRGTQAAESVLRSIGYRA